jgi:HrpA-like RNA helicase
VLVFLTGQEEIESLGRLLKARSQHVPEGKPRLNVVLLFAAMPPEAGGCTSQIHLTHSLKPHGSNP